MAVGMSGLNKRDFGPFKLVFLFYFVWNWKRKMNEIKIGGLMMGWRREREWEGNKRGTISKRGEEDAYDFLIDREDKGGGGKREGKKGRRRWKLAVHGGWRWQ